MQSTILYDLVQSWRCEEGKAHDTDELLAWIQELNENTYVNIRESGIGENSFWFYDDYSGEVLNRKRAFFSIKGMRYFVNKKFISEQPILFQPEIGYLGIICQKIGGVLHLLMQAKIEPGNVNCVQISPTVQATKSNFTRVHGGNTPPYFAYFENAYKYRVLYDQIQSEQSARFYKKRNRNIVIEVDEDIEVQKNFRWMTLGQLKRLMKIDNLVNMDTRTVVSGLPFCSWHLDGEALAEIGEMYRDKALFASTFFDSPAEALPEIYQKINNYKMFEDVDCVPVPLSQLVHWEIDEYGITCQKPADFMVRYYDIQIAGREVKHWFQPLFKAIGSATFGTFTRIHDGKREFLVKLKPEIGAFDKVEIGPAIQLEGSHYQYYDDAVEKMFRRELEKREHVLIDVVLSEEGGRFYHEQNRNVILQVGEDFPEALPPNYLWVSYATLNYLVAVNNCLNIQLRNLLSLIDI